MDALFHHTAEILKDFDPSEEIASHFRTLMTEGQTMEEHNIFRKEFYLEVIRMAEEKKQKATIEMVCLFFFNNHQLSLSLRLVLHQTSPQVMLRPIQIREMSLANPAGYSLIS